MKKSGYLFKYPSIFNKFYSKYNTQLLHIPNKNNNIELNNTDNLEIS